MKKTDHKPPQHLSKPARAWYLSMQAEYGVHDQGGISLLSAAAEAWDRCQSAREAVEADGGPVIRDRFDQVKPHPACAIERDARSQFINALKALNLDIEPLRDRGRPTTPLGWTGD